MGQRDKVENFEKIPLNIEPQQNKYNHATREKKMEQRK
jgi:hypothetical protein